ncbi:MAG TPA: MFS transporter [Gammaproteobacteria bacterium]|nr:MFS transporter [Gammaproteobacteria bacterium]
MERTVSIRWWPIVLCALAVLLDGYDAQMLAMAIPLMAKEFGVPPTAFAPAASASLAGMAVGALFLSPLADRFGRRLVLIVSLVLFGSATLLAMTSGGPFEMTLWRLLAGCGFGATVPVTIGISGDLAPAGRRVSIATIAASGFAIGASSAGLITPLLAAHWGWRGMFAYGGILPLVIAALAVRGIPDSRPTPAVASGRPASARDQAPAGAPRIELIFAAGTWRRTVLLWLLNALNLFANYGVASWLPTLLVQNGWSLPDASRVMSVLAIGAITGSVFVSRCVDRGRIVLGFVGAYFVAALSLALCAANPSGFWIWAGLLVLFGFGAIGTALTHGPLAMILYDDEARSTGIGWANGFGRAGSLFGPLGLAWLMNQQLPPTQVLGALIVPMLGCAACVLLLVWALRAEGRQHALRDAANVPS